MRAKVHGNEDLAEFAERVAADPEQIARREAARRGDLRGQRVLTRADLEARIREPKRR